MKTIGFGFFCFFSQKALVPKQPPCTGPFVLGMNAVLCSWRSTQLVSAATWSKHLFMKVHRLACALFTLDMPCWSYTLQWLGVVVDKLCHGPRQLVFPLHVFSLACFVSARPRQSTWSRLVCEKRLQRIRVRVRWRCRVHCGEPPERERPTGDDAPFWESTITWSHIEPCGVC